MRKRTRRRRQRRGRRRAQPGADLDHETARHPLGAPGQDRNEDFAYIVGFTDGGCPYGIPWHEADWLLDEPEFGDWVRWARGRVADRVARRGESNAPPF